MSVARPFYRCARPGSDGDWSAGGRGGYVVHPDYAPDAAHYLRAYSLLEADLRRLFEFIEPADQNEETYSYRCLELLLRACGEVEANCRVILAANGYDGGQWNMKDYAKLNATHRLSSYRVRLPAWTGEHSVRAPFDDWTGGEKLVAPRWFKAHHGGKHNRHLEFPSANLANVVDSVAAVVVLLAAQFITNDFGPMSRTIEMEYDFKDGFEHAIGGYFYVRFPSDWPEDERYAFDWQRVRRERAPFMKLFAEHPGPPSTAAL